VKAAVYLGGGQVVVEDRPEPMPGPGEVVLAMRACGLCGSDLMEWYQDPRVPVVLGHEPMGVVVAAGEWVDAPLPVPGTRVFAHHHVPCERCEYCARGRETLCDTFKATRIVPGGFSELILVPAPNAAVDLLELPDAVSDEAATLIEPLACCIRGLKKARVGRDTRLLVIGGGQMGLLLACSGAAAGATVTVAEPRMDRRSLAPAFGARGVAPVRDAVGNPTVVILATYAPEAWELALAVADRGAVIQLFAPAAPDQTRAFNVNELFFRELEIQATYSAGPRDTRAALALLASGAVPVSRLITHRFGLHEVDAALAAARSREGLKVIVTNP
jgi:L-iditol 2-dehydrogenase